MTGIVLLGLLLIYSLIACAVAYWFGRIDDCLPAWGAVFWPVIVPFFLLMIGIEWANNHGVERSKRRARTSTAEPT